ncbi:hypothetical protein QE152_g4975 [Popillia japonica]|uniref:Uncharacterized protein n=1 Tax=Popillia japonica TaxID=7064 RepID=A0AAW1MYG3_POPJA
MSSSSSKRKSDYIGHRVQRTGLFSSASPVLKRFIVPLSRWKRYIEKGSKRAVSSDPPTERSDKSDQKVDNIVAVYNGSGTDLTHRRVRSSSGGNIPESIMTSIGMEEELDQIYQKDGNKAVENHQLVIMTSIGMEEELDQIYQKDGNKAVENHQLVNMTLPETAAE